MSALLKIVFILTFTAAVTTAAQSNTTKSSISGSVQEIGNAAPLAGVQVSVSPGGKSAHTDKAGRYEIKDLAPGTYRVTAYSIQARGQGPHGAKVVQLNSGQDLTVDFRLTTKASISGRVLDNSGEPSPGVQVFLIAREYRLGALRYVYAGISETDDRGQYALTNVEPGTGYFIEAVKRNRNLSPISDAPLDSKLRKKAVVPTWYPDSDTLDAAQPVVLQPGEHREGMDFRLKRSISYCADGILGTDNGPAPLGFFIEEQEPTSGLSGNGGMFVNAPHGGAGPDGRIRICDLHPGVYRLSVFKVQDPDSKTSPIFFGETEIPIGDKDGHNVKVFGRPNISVSGEIVWDGKPPDQSVPAKVSLWRQPMTRAPFQWELSSTLPPPMAVPGQFTLPGLLTGDYSITVRNVPSGAYLKDIVYGGESALHQPMRVGKTMGSDLRIVLARDGGTVNVKVADKDNNPAPDCNVVLLPESAATEAALADAMLQGQTDQYGAYTSGSLAPGKYFVLATTSSIDRTPESIAKLLRARTHAQEADLQPNGSVQLTLLPIILE